MAKTVKEFDQAAEMNKSSLVDRIKMLEPHMTPADEMKKASALKLANEIEMKTHSYMEDELAKDFSPTLKKQLGMTSSPEVKEITKKAMDEGIKNQIMGKDALKPLAEDNKGISSITEALHKEALVAPSEAAKVLGVNSVQR